MSGDTHGGVDFCTDCIWGNRKIWCIAKSNLPRLQVITNEGPLAEQSAEILKSVLLLKIGHALADVFYSKRGFTVRRIKPENLVSCDI